MVGFWINFKGMLANMMGSCVAYEEETKEGVKYDSKTYASATETMELPELENIMLKGGLRK